jgi:hypothetical protein
MKPHVRASRSSAEIRALIGPPPKISHTNSDAARANGLI